MSTYPTRQPFPRVRAVSIEASASPTSPALANLRTYEFLPYPEAYRLLNAYLDQYETGGGGAALGIKGEFGSGKTHLIYCLTELARAGRDTLPESSAPAQAYAKAKSGVFFDLYRDLINAIGARQLAQTHVKVLSAAARRLAKDRDSTNDDGLVDAAVKRLKEEPKVVLDLIRDALVSETDIVGSAAAELRGGSSRFTDFFSAFTFLNDINLQATAFSWFTGDPLDRQKLDRLGVSGPLTEPDADRGLQFLSMMFSFAHTPLMVYIDQLERLLLDDIERSIANRGHLHTLIESLVSNQNMLIVAGISQSWDKLPADFVQRLTAPPMTMPSLDTKQTQAVIAVYLAGDKDKPDLSKIFPFTKDGVAEIVKVSRGNIRSIISLCYSCFELVAPGEKSVSIGIVRKAAESLQKLYSRTTVLEEISGLLRAERYRFEKRVELTQVVQDVVVFDGSDPRIVINVMEPVFLEDEAGDAHRHAAAAQRLRSVFPNIRVILVDVGYRSGEIEDKLKPPLISYVRYDPDEFRAEFKGMLQAIQNPVEGLGGPETSREITVVNESIRQLQELVLIRADEQARINERLTEVLRSMGSPVVNVQNRIDGNASLHRWWTRPSFLLSLGGIYILATLAAFGYYYIERQSRQSAVARSLEFVGRGSSDPVRAARDKTYDFLSPTNRSLGNKYSRGDSLFSLLLGTSVSSPVQTLLDYYGSVAICIRGGLCDRSTACEALVPQITSLQSTIARSAELSGSTNVGGPASDKAKWTEADRLLSTCQT